MLLPRLAITTTLASVASAFFPWIPDYRCTEEGTCLSTKREVDSTTKSPAVNSIRIVQRLPTDNASHDDRVKRLADRLVRKYQGGIIPKNDIRQDIEQRENTYTVMAAPTPTQANSAGIYQDGTDYSYFAPITIGSAETKMYMLLDTGADRSWVMSSTCTSNPCLNHNLFDASTSTTSELSTTEFSISYGSGSVSGVMNTDTISFAGMNLPMTFGLANITSDDFLNFPIDGILGLSLSRGDTPSFIDRVVASKALKSNIFGVSLNRMSDGSNTGEINFGSPDSTRFNGDLVYMAVDAGASGNWAIPMDNVGFGSTQSGLTGRLAYLDTGTSFIFCPPKDAIAFHALIDGVKSDDNVTFHVPCTSADSINFTFGGTTFAVSTKDWIGPEVNGVCTSNVYGRSVVGDTNWLIGDTFLKNVYAVFDVDKTRIGLAAVKSAVASSLASSNSLTTSVVVESTSSISSKTVTMTSGSSTMVSVVVSTVITQISSTVVSSTPTTATGGSMPGLNGHQTTDATTVGGSVAAVAETSTPSSSSTLGATTTHTSSSAGRLNFKFATKLLGAAMLARLFV